MTYLLLLYIFLLILPIFANIIITESSKLYYKNTQWQIVYFRGKNKIQVSFLPSNSFVS